MFQLIILFSLASRGKGSETRAHFVPKWIQLENYFVIFLRFSFDYECFGNVSKNLMCVLEYTNQFAMIVYTLCWHVTWKFLFPSSDSEENFSSNGIIAREWVVRDSIMR